MGPSLSSITVCIHHFGRTMAVFLLSCPTRGHNSSLFFAVTPRNKMRYFGFVHINILIRSRHGNVIDMSVKNVGSRSTDSTT
jgi:hypothetical protein